MTIHVQMIESPFNGDLVDIEYFCNSYCYTAHTGLPAVNVAWPGGSETDYDVHCAHCESLLWRGLEWEGDNAGN